MSTKSNKIIIEEFAELFYKQKEVKKAFLEYVDKDYIQHNPNIPDGRDNAIEMLEPKFSTAEAIFDIKRILIDGDFAMIHLHGRMSADSLGGAVADIYRLKDGKIVEHWDVIQPIPENCVNKHPMF